ncbi:MAG: TetR/AcrR family transcriptional regulator [Acidimicrobiales bacterium]
MASSRDAKARLIDAASDLFYTDGFAPTPVDRVVERSGVSKPTLYVHFPSKDALLAAALEQRHAERARTLDAWVHSADSSPCEQLLAVFDWLAHWHETQRARGCAFVNAAAELADPTHPAREIARRHKQWMRDYLAGLAREARLSSPERLGADLMLLIDGANSRVLVDGDLAAAHDARRIAAVLIAASRTDQ